MSPKTLHSANLPSRFLLADQLKKPSLSSSSSAASVADLASSCPPSSSPGHVPSSSSSSSHAASVCRMPPVIHSPSSASSSSSCSLCPSSSSPLHDPASHEEVSAPRRWSGEERPDKTSILCQADGEDTLVVVRPEQFRVYDVILVSYDTLREEIWFSPPSSRAPQSRGLRLASSLSADRESSTSRAGRQGGSFSPSSFVCSNSSSSSAGVFPSSSLPTGVATDTTSASLKNLLVSSSSSLLSSSLSTRGCEAAVSDLSSSSALSSYGGDRSAASRTSSASTAIGGGGGGGWGLRRRKKYRVLHSPLLRVHWWRLLIDEAQMVGGEWCFFVSSPSSDALHPRTSAAFPSVPVSLYLSARGSFSCSSACMQTAANPRASPALTRATAELALLPHYVPFLFASPPPCLFFRHQQELLPLFLTRLLLFP